MNKKKHAPRLVGMSLLFLIAASLFIYASPAQAQSLDALYDKAKSEGALVLYAGGPTAPWDAAAKDFSARYPGVTVSVTGGFSNVLDKKIDAQLAAGKLEVDMAMFQTLQDFVRWKQQGAAPRVQAARLRQNRRQLSKTRPEPSSPSRSTPTLTPTTPTW